MDQTFDNRTIDNRMLFRPVCQTDCSVIGRLLYMYFFSGSRCDSQLPAIARQCRDFALESNENGRMGQKTSPPESVEGSESMQAEDGTPLEEEEEEEETRPDLSQIIRSLDTPPPS